MDINNYRNCINNLINWEWNTLKLFRKKRRRNVLLRGSFTIFSLASILFCIFLPPYILSNVLIAIGIPYSAINWIQIISFFVWLWFICHIDKLSKNEREEKNKKKVELVKAVEKDRVEYENKLK